MLNIFDCNNFIRRQYEVDTSGLALRNMYGEAAARSPYTSIYVFDGRNAKASRRAIFPGYKVGRQKAPDDFYKTLDVAKKVLACAPQLLVDIEGFEADDTIASIVRTTPDTPITIYSNDGDFRRLCSEHVKMSDPTLTQVDAKEVRLYKTLVGDSSDKIPGFKSFGEAAWGKLTDVQKDNWRGLLTGRFKPVDLREEDFGIKITQLPWLVMNIKDLQSYWQIVGFLDVPEDLMEKGMTVGILNRDKAKELLRSVMQ